MNTNFVSPDAATGTTTAFSELKINRTMSVHAKFKPKGTDSPLTGECEDCFYVTP